MKIFQVINVRWYNATAWYCVYLSRLLHEAGHDVLVIGQEGTPPLQEAERLGLRTHALDLNSANPLILARTLARMRTLIRTLQPEVVNCHRGEGFIFWGLLKQLMRGDASYRLVRTRGDQRPPKKSLLNRWLHSALADAVVVTNSAAAFQCREALNVPANKLWLIYGGVDTTRFCFSQPGRERVRSEFGFTPDDIVIGLVGRFDTVKGQRELLEALARLRKTAPHLRAKLLLVGHDSALPTTAVTAWVREFDLQDHVCITGRRQDVPDCISAMDIGVVASLWSEAIARAALEIMACGRPLFSTAVGVMPDLLGPEAICPPGDVAALATLLEKGAADPAFLAAITKEQHQRIAQLSGHAFLHQTLSVYTSVL